MLRNLVIAMIVVLVGVALYWGFSEKESKASERSSASVAENEDRMAELEAEVARMKTEVKRASLQSRAAVRMGSTMMPAATQSDDKPEEEEENELPEEFEARLEKQKQVIGKRFEELSTIHQRETRDPSWAETAETELREIVQQLGESEATGATILSNECKGTMCRIDMAYENSAAQSQVSDKIRSMFFGGGEVRRYEENGQLRSTTYVYRQGYGVPIQ